MVELINVYAINYVSSGIFFINILIILQFAKVFSVCVAKHLKNKENMIEKAEKNEITVNVFS